MVVVGFAGGAGSPRRVLPGRLGQDPQVPPRRGQEDGVTAPRVAAAPTGTSGGDPRELLFMFSMS